MFLRKKKKQNDKLYEMLDKKFFFIQFLKAE